MTKSEPSRFFNCRVWMYAKSSNTSEQRAQLWNS